MEEKLDKILSDLAFIKANFVTKEYLDGNFATKEYINKLEKEKRIMVLEPQKEVTVSRLERDKEKLKSLYLDGVLDMENRLKELKDMIK